MLLVVYTINFKELKPGFHMSPIVGETLSVVVEEENYFRYTYTDNGAPRLSATNEKIIARLCISKWSFREFLDKQIAV